MKKVDKAAIAAFNSSDALASAMRVVDAKSGEAIAQVIEADADAGKLRRYAVEDGLLVREDNAFKIIDEDRAIRIEPVAGETPPAGASGSADA